MNKLKQTKQIKEAFNEYLLKAISTEDYNLKIEPVTNKERLQFLYNTFKAEFGHEIKQYGQYKAFNDWIQGLPTAFKILFRNNEIIEYTETLYKCKLTEKEKEKILNNWFNFVTTKTFKLFEKYNINFKE